MKTKLRVPKAWNTTASASVEASSVDMSADTVDKLLCPITREPMKIVRIFYRNADGSMDPSYVAVHPESRVVLPLPNDLLQAYTAAHPLGETQPPAPVPTHPQFG